MLVDVYEYILYCTITVLKANNSYIYSYSNYVRYMAVIKYIDKTVFIIFYAFDYEHFITKEKQIIFNCGFLKIVNFSQFYKLSEFITL